jgi:hypothetical protein
MPCFTDPRYLQVDRRLYLADGVFGASRIALAWNIAWCVHSSEPFLEKQFSLYSFRVHASFVLICTFYLMGGYALILVPLLKMS